MTRKIMFLVLFVLFAFSLTAVHGQSPGLPDAPEDSPDSDGDEWTEEDVEKLLQEAYEFQLALEKPVWEFSLLETVQVNSCYHEIVGETLHPGFSGGIVVGTYPESGQVAVIYLEGGMEGHLMRTTLNAGWLLPNDKICE